MYVVEKAKQYQLCPPLKSEKKEHFPVLAKTANIKSGLFGWLTIRYSLFLKVERNWRDINILY